MELKGQTRADDLPAVFHMLAQLLAMTAKEGLLTVWDDSKRKSVYFSRRGVTLLFPSDNKRTAPLTGQTLVQRGRITEGDLQQALHRQTAAGGGKLLGQVLCEMKLVSEDEIYDVVREQVEEELIDMLSWEKAQFQFEETTPPQELADQTRSYTTLTLNPTELLLEAVRRLDEAAAEANGVQEVAKRPVLRTEAR
jgi:hypothetical protein